jgi:hypothetical protein
MDFSMAKNTPYFHVSIPISSCLEIYLILSGDMGFPIGKGHFRAKACMSTNDPIIFAPKTSVLWEGMIHISGIAKPHIQSQRKNY